MTARRRQHAGLTRSGDRFCTTEDVPVGIGTVWRAPIHTGSARAVLPKATILVALDGTRGATSFSCYPEDYDRLEPLLVPDDDRRQEAYFAYYVSAPVSWIGTVLAPLPPIAPRPDNGLPRRH